MAVFVGRSVGRSVKVFWCPTKGLSTLRSCCQYRHDELAGFEVSSFQRQRKGNRCVPMTTPISEEDRQYTRNVQRYERRFEVRSTEFFPALVTPVSVFRFYIHITRSSQLQKGFLNRHQPPIRTIILYY